LFEDVSRFGEQGGELGHAHVFESDLDDVVLRE
jgi:hypothetical protein